MPTLFQLEHDAFRESSRLTRPILEALPEESLWRQYGLDAIDYWAAWFADPDNYGKPIPNLRRVRD